MSPTIKRIIGGGLGLALSAMIVTSPAMADTIVLTFEGLQNAEGVNDFYNGGTGSFGSGPGSNVGIRFTNAFAFVDGDAGGSGNFGGEPSPSTAITFLGADSTVMNVAAGFDTGFSFYYTSPFALGSVTVWDGLDATGNVLATLTLGLTPDSGAPDPTGQFSPFVPFGVSFIGIARSVDFSGTANQIGFDDITLGSATPGPSRGVPEPGSLVLLAAGALGAGVVRRWLAAGR